MLITFISCKTNSPNINKISDTNCIPQIDRSKGQLVVLTFQKDNKILTAKKADQKPRENNLLDQYGHLNIYFSYYTQNPVLEDQFIFVHQRDTMKLNIFLKPTLNHFIDSIPFLKGEFTLTPEMSKLAKDPFYLNYSKYLYGSERGQEQFYERQEYLSYVNNSGINLSSEHAAISDYSKLSNPFENRFYCSSDPNEKDLISAKNYISDILNRQFIEFKILSIKK